MTDVAIIVLSLMPVVPDVISWYMERRRPLPIARALGASPTSRRRPRAHCARCHRVMSWDTDDERLRGLLRILRSRASGRPTEDRLLGIHGRARVISFSVVSARDPEFLAALRRHYSGSRQGPYGKKIVWRIIEGQQTVGWIGVGEPSFRLAARARLCGVVDTRALPQSVGCFVYRLEGPRETSASEILRLWHPICERHIDGDRSTWRRWWIRRWSRLETRIQERASDAPDGA